MRLYTSICLLLISSLLFAQPAQEKLEQRKLELLKQIEMNEKQLQTQKQKERSVVDQILQQQNKIKLRQQLIEVNVKQAKNLENEIYVNHLAIRKMSRELDTLKADYASMIQKSYKSRSERSRAMFLLSSESFLQAYKRSQYMKQYASFRKSQGEEIKVKAEELDQITAVLEKQKNEKEKIIAENEKEKQSLEKEKKEQEVLMASIKKNQKSIIADIKKQQQEVNKIEKEIKRMIAAAIAAENKKTGVKPSKPGSFGLTPEGKIVSKNFQQNQGKLPWPVKKGYISAPFGKYPHPIVKTLIKESNGVEISTEKGSEAYAVFEGEVVRIQVSSPINKTIMIRHGDFVTVYKNIETLHVKTGDKVNLGQSLGVIHTNDFTGKTEMNFYILRNESFLNPQKWIARM
jgi:septal ring factor EnvC (AmiA/AmiB activator)